MSSVHIVAGLQPFCTRNKEQGIPKVSVLATLQNKQVHGGVKSPELKV